MALCSSSGGGSNRGSSSSGEIALSPGIETQACSRQRVRRLQHTVRRSVSKRDASDIDIGFRRESQSYIHAGVDVGERVEDVVVGGGVFAFGAHVVDGGEGAG